MIAYTQRDVIGRETAITGLRLDLKGATSFPTWVLELPNLYELSLTKAQFGSLPVALWQLPKLEKLKLQRCGLTSLSVLGQLAGLLRQLDLSDNQLTDWPTGLLTALPALEELRLSNNQLANIGNLQPPVFSSLKKLYLDNNELQQLPPALFQLTQLRELDLQHNKLGQLPTAIGQLSQLDRLNFSHNRLRRLPEQIGKLEQLSQLVVANNRLEQIPDTLATCHMLRKIDLHHNRLSTFPSALRKLPWLSELQLSRNRLEVLPDILANFNSLGVLDVSNNQLRKLPDSIADMPKLRELRAADNQLTSLPPLPPTLHAIDLSGNQFHYLPDSLKSSPGLRELKIERNHILALPTDLGRLPETLVRLSMARNPVRLSIEDLLPLRMLRELTGLLHPATRRHLLLAQQTARTLDLPQAFEPAFLKLLRGDRNVLTEFSPEAIRLALNHPIGKVVARVRDYVRRHYGQPVKGRQLRAGSVLSLVGRTFFKQEQLATRLAAAGIAWAPDYDPQRTTHVLMGFPPISDLILPNRQVIMNERQLARRLDQLEKKPLLRERSSSRLSRLRRLLTSHDRANIRLGFRMVNGNGLPPSLWNELLAAYYLSETDPSLQMEIKSYIRLRLQDQGKNKFFAVLTPQLIKWGKIKPEKEKLLRRNGFDLATIRAYLLNKS